MIKIDSLKNISELFNAIYKNKKVLITGHTGFKGSWLAFWLNEMCADVIGYSLPPPTCPNHFDLLKIPITSIIGDICDDNKLYETFETYKPEIVFHMAAQPLVRLSYEQPKKTFESNVIGTVNVFEACRKTVSVKAIINVTSDKCYENKEWIWGYRENDPMGGNDPYSASKGCAELITNAYRQSFFNAKKQNTLLASVRSGNVIGGGDWAEDRLVPDIMRAVNQNKKVVIRNPNATRPWQHVLEPLSGYLFLGQKLLQKDISFADAWNFGPSNEASITVEKVIHYMNGFWNVINYEKHSSINQPHEANLLALDCSKSNIRLGWKGVWDSLVTFERTTNWYKNYYQSGKISTRDDLMDYIRDAKNKQMGWTL